MALSADAILPFLFVLTLVIFIHELGHYWVARLCGVRVEVFSIGFGREVVGWTDKRGTRWKVSWIPLGGYVMFFGDNDPASTPDGEKLDHMSAADKAVSFHHKNRAQRAAIAAAGPFANFVLAIGIFWALFTFVGQTVLPAKVGAVSEGSAAYEAGFLAGDEILAIDGEEVESFGDLRRLVALSGGAPLTFEIARDGAIETLIAAPRAAMRPDGMGGETRQWMLGVSVSAADGDVIHKRFGPVEALGKAVGETRDIVTGTLGYLGRVITGRESADQLGGPIRIAQISEQAASIGVAALLSLVAILSTSIGLINLLPVPMLDGGQILFLTIEGVMRRPINQKVMEVSFRFGLVFVLALMVFALWNDVTQLGLFN